MLDAPVRPPSPAFRGRSPSAPKPDKTTRSHPPFPHASPPLASSPPPHPLPSSLLSVLRTSLSPPLSVFCSPLLLVHFVSRLPASCADPHFTDDRYGRRVRAPVHTPVPVHPARMDEQRAAAPLARSRTSRPTGPQGKVKLTDVGFALRSRRPRGWLHGSDRRSDRHRRSGGHHRHRSVLADAGSLLRVEVGCLHQRGPLNES
jgi:hypothetical protein